MTRLRSTDEAPQRPRKTQRTKPSSEAEIASIYFNDGRVIETKSFTGLENGLNIVDSIEYSENSFFGKNGPVFITRDGKCGCAVVYRAADVKMYKIKKV